MKSMNIFIYIEYIYIPQNSGTKKGSNQITLDELKACGGCACKISSCMSSTRVGQGTRDTCIISGRQATLLGPPTAISYDHLLYISIYFA
jgi:hypothetical protein